MTNVIFPPWARFVLGLLIAFVGFLASGNVLELGENERLLLAGIAALFASAGIVPPKPGDLPPLSPALRFLLLLLVLVITYVIQELVDGNTIRGILQALLLLFASVGLIPPQSEARAVNPGADTGRRRV